MTPSPRTWGRGRRSQGAGGVILFSEAWEPEAVQEKYHLAGRLALLWCLLMTNCRVPYISLN